MGASVGSGAAVSWPHAESSRAASIKKTTVIYKGFLIFFLLSSKRLEFFKLHLRQFPEPEINYSYNPAGEASYKLSPKIFI
jgi:hypothetical protein